MPFNKRSEDASAMVRRVPTKLGSKNHCAMRGNSLCLCIHEPKSKGYACEKIEQRKRHPRPKVCGGLVFLVAWIGGASTNKRQTQRKTPLGSSRRLNTTDSAITNPKQIAERKICKLHLSGLEQPQRHARLTRVISIARVIWDWKLFA